MLTFLVVSYFFGWVGGGWGGVVGEVRDKAISTQVVVEVEVGVKLDNSHSYFSSNIATIEKYFILQCYTWP